MIKVMSNELASETINTREPPFNIICSSILGFKKMIAFKPDI